MHMDAQLVTLIFTIVTGVGVLLQALVLFGIFLAVRKTAQKVSSLSEKIEDHVLPLVTTSRGVLEDISPKLRTITANLVESSATLRSQTEQVKTVVEDISARTRTQTARVDGIVTSTLNSVMQATTAIERGVAGPLRQVSGLLNGLRAGLDTLRAPVPTKQPPSAARVPTRPTPASAPFASAATATPVASASTSSAPSVARPAPGSPVSDFATTTDDASASVASFVRDRAAAERR